MQIKGFLPLLWSHRLQLLRDHQTFGVCLWWTSHKQFPCLLSTSEIQTGYLSRPADFSKATAKWSRNPTDSFTTDRHWCGFYINLIDENSGDLHLSICCIECVFENTWALVTHPDASAVVLDLQELQSAFFHRHLDIGGFCIQTATFKRTRVINEHRIEVINTRFMGQGEVRSLPPTGITTILYDRLWICMRNGEGKTF